MSEPICVMTTGNPDDYECSCPGCREDRHELDRYDLEMGRGER